MSVISKTEPAVNAASALHPLGIASRPDRMVMIVLCSDDIENPAPDTFPSFTFNAVNVPMVSQSRDIGPVGGAFGLIRIFAIRNDLLPADAGSYTAAITWSAATPLATAWSVFTLDDMDQSATHVVSNVVTGDQTTPIVTTLSRSTLVGIRWGRDGTTPLAIATSTSGHTRVLAKVTGLGAGEYGFHAAVRSSSESNSAGQSVSFNWSSNVADEFYQRIVEFPSYQGNKAIMLGTNF